MGEIIAIVSQEAVESAWDEYHALVLPMLSNPQLLIDRPYREALRRAERKWQRLFDRMDG